MENQQYHLFFKRVKVQHSVELITFELPGGLAFLFRRFHMIQPEYKIYGGPVTVIHPPVFVELTDGTGATRWQSQAIPALEYSAPRKDGVVVKTETAPVDQSAYGVNLSACFKPRSVTVNLHYDVGENVFIRLSNMLAVIGTPDYSPNYVDIAAEGVFIP